jgi:hypothetical protein
MPGRMIADNGSESAGGDNYEDDDTYDQANVIALNGAAPQVHNFDNPDDEDWVKFYGIYNDPKENSGVYEIKIGHVGREADPVIEIYDVDGQALLKGPWSFGFEGEGELLNWRCPADGIYFIKIYHHPEADFGENMDYELEVYRPIGPLFGFIAGTVTNAVNGESIAGATLKTDLNQTALSLDDGSYVMGHTSGEFVLTAGAAQYIPASIDIEVTEGGLTTQNIALVPLNEDFEIRAFVTRFYQLCLKRDPDPAGLDGWVTALLNGTLTGSDVAYGFVLSPEFISTNTNDKQFLQILYEAFFNRQPDAAGLQGWLDALDKGASREDVLKGYIFAAEFSELCENYGIKAFEGHITAAQRKAVEAFVTRFYQLCLDRDPDPAGLEGWSNHLLNQTQTGADVANGFIYSREFQEKNTSDSDFLVMLYNAFFDREPDPGGRDSWLSELEAGRDRREVLSGFIYSTEFAELCRRFEITPYR